MGKWSLPPSYSHPIKLTIMRSLGRAWLRTRLVTAPGGNEEGGYEPFCLTLLKFDHYEGNLNHALPLPTQR